jgi:hypothetical protein
MQLTSVLFYLATLTNLAVASPLETHRTHLTPKASVDADIEGGESTPGLSKRTEFNVLDKRDSGSFYSCSDTACLGSCIPYDIPNTREQCIGTFQYNSFYVANAVISESQYAVYVGYSCSGSNGS